MTISATSFLSGISYINSNRLSSIIARKPRAPVFRSIAFLAIARKASSVNVNLTFSISNMVTYCLTKAFLGSVNTLTKASSSKSPKVAIIGRRPTNSGIKPYFSKSSGWTSLIISPMPRSSSAATFAPKPIEVSLPRRLTIFPARQKRHRR